MATPVAPTPTPNPPRRRRRSTTATIVWIIAIVVVAGGALIGGVFTMLGHSDACKLAIQRAQSNQVVVERLGEPLKQGWPVQGNIQVSGSSGHADLAIPLSGSKSKGTLYAVAEKRAGAWQFKTLELAVENSGDRINLLAGGSEEALIITLVLSSADQPDRIYELEDKLSAAVKRASAGEFDGDEFGKGTCTLYMYGPDAERLYRATIGILKEYHPAKGSYVITRFGQPGAKQERTELSQ